MNDGLRVGKGLAYTLDTGVRQCTVAKGKVRRLTPIECERLQGFPDDWTKYGLFDGEVKVISDCQRYKMLGNAVSVPIVQAVGKRLLDQPVGWQAVSDYDRMKLLTAELGLWNTNIATA